MNILRRELAERAELLEAFKGLPRDLKVKIQTFFKSHKPTQRCPLCHRLHYPLFCNHYCQPECFLVACKNLLWYADEEYSSEDESV